MISNEFINKILDNNGSNGDGRSIFEIMPKPSNSRNIIIKNEMMHDNQRPIQPNNTVKEEKSIFDEIEKIQFTTKKEYDNLKVELKEGLSKIQNAEDVMEMILSKLDDYEKSLIEYKKLNENKWDESITTNNINNNQCITNQPDKKLESDTYITKMKTYLKKRYIKISDSVFESEIQKNYPNITEKWKDLIYYYNNQYYIKHNSRYLPLDNKLTFIKLNI